MAFMALSTILVMALAAGCATGAARYEGHGLVVECTQRSIGFRIFILEDEDVAYRACKDALEAAGFRRVP